MDIMKDFQEQFDNIDFDNEDISLDVSIHPQHPITYPLMCMVFEAGEAGNKFKKVLRDNNGILESTTKHDLLEELGDVLFYLTYTARLLGCSLEDVVFVLNTKLEERYGPDSMQVSINGIPRRVPRR